MLAMRSTQDSTIPPSQSAEFLRKDEVDLYRSPWQYIRSDLVALREMANTGDLKKRIPSLHTRDHMEFLY